MISDFFYFNVTFAPAASSFFLISSASPHFVQEHELKAKCDWQQNGGPRTNLQNNLK
jgi:hypothetical protein